MPQERHDNVCYDQRKQNTSETLSIPAKINNLVHRLDQLRKYLVETAKKFFYNRFFKSTYVTFLFFQVLLFVLRLMLVVYSDETSPYQPMKDFLDRTVYHADPHQPFHFDIFQTNKYHHHLTVLIRFFFWQLLLALIFVILRFVQKSARKFTFKFLSILVFSLMVIVAVVEFFYSSYYFTFIFDRNLIEKEIEDLLVDGSSNNLFGLRALQMELSCCEIKTGNYYHHNLLPAKCVMEEAPNCTEMLTRKTVSAPALALMLVFDIVVLLVTLSHGKHSLRPEESVVRRHSCASETDALTSNHDQNDCDSAAQGSSPSTESSTNLNQKIGEQTGIKRRNSSSKVREATQRKNIPTETKFSSTGTEMSVLRRQWQQPTEAQSKNITTERKFNSSGMHERTRKL